MLVISNGPTLVRWCNEVLMGRFQIVWVKTLQNMKFNPFAAVTDLDSEEFQSIYTFFKQRKIKIFKIFFKDSVSDLEWKIFDFAGYIKMGDDFLLKNSLDFLPINFRNELDFRLTEYNQKLFCAAQSDETVLFLGQMGAGKTHDALLLHQYSPRKNRPFIHFNISEHQDSIESELFGVEKNTFTGVEQKEGVLNQTGEGTLFFDEITEIPMHLQSKLLTVISERKFRPKGSNREERFHGRFVFATNADIDKMVHEKKFRADLYSRINVLRLKVPNLNQRSQEIAGYAKKFASEKHKILSRDAINTLENFKWTGNIRQLRNIVVRACTFAKSDLIQRGDLSFD